MRDTRVPRLPLAIAVLIAIVGSLLAVSKANSEAAGTATLGPAQRQQIVAVARNARKLKGKPPSAYLDRVAFRSATGALPVPLGATEILPGTNITVPGAVKLVRVTGTATLSGGASNYILWFALDEACTASGVGFDNRQFGNTTQQTSTTVDFVLPVAAGVHTVRLCASGNPGVNTHTRTLVIETVAKGPTGGASLAAPAGRAAPDRDADPATPR